jgi:hypothetical protein
MSYRMPNKRGLFSKMYGDDFLFFEKNPYKGHKPYKAAPGLVGRLYASLHVDL